MSPLARFEHANWRLVPDHLHRDLERWLLDGKLVRSHFLNFILRNDLLAAVRSASPTEKAALVDIVTFLADECPHEAYGSVEDWIEWRAMGGWRGLQEAAQRV